MGSAAHVGVFERRVRALTEAFTREFPASDQSVLFGGRTMTMAEVVSSLQQMLETLEAVHRTHRAFRQAVADRRRASQSHRGTYEDAVFFLKHQLGRENPRLGSFGVPLPKPRKKPTTEAKAIARAKAAATRRARGTMGKLQRLALQKAREGTVQVFGSDGQPLVTTEEAAAEPEAKPSWEFPSGPTA